MRVQSSKFKVQSREKVQSSKFKAQSKKHFELCTLHSELKGYTLIEVLVALAVLIIGFTALTTMTMQARRAAIAAEELSTVQLACQTRVNEMLAGVVPFAPAFDEPVAGLDNWFLTVELFPATKPGVTAVRAQMSRQYLPGDTQERHAGADFYEITHWVNNSRLDPQLVQAMQRNPFALTAAAMSHPQNGMPGMTGGATSLVDMTGGATSLADMTGGATSLVDVMGGAQGGAMPPGGMGGANYGAMSAGGYAGGTSYGTMYDVPPLSLDDYAGRSNGAMTASAQGRQSGASPGQSARPGTNASRGNPLATDVPPPLDIPLDDPLASTVAPSAGGESTASSTDTAAFTPAGTATEASSQDASPSQEDDAQPQDAPPASDATQAGDNTQIGGGNGNASPGNSGGGASGGGSSGGRTGGGRGGNRPNTGGGNQP